MSFIWLLICQIDNEYSSHLTQVKEHGFLQHMFSSIIFDSLNITIYILTTLFIMNIVFPESGMQLESNHDDEGNENFQKKKKISYVYHSFRYTFPWCPLTESPVRTVSYCYLMWYFMEDVNTPLDESSFPFRAWMNPSTPAKFVSIWQIERVG